MGISSLMENIGEKRETVVGCWRAEGRLPGIDALYLLSRTGLDKFVVDEEADRLLILAAIGRRE